MAGLLSQSGFSQTASLLRQIESHFKWGEYDSIIAKVEPVVHDSKLVKTSKDRSEFSKFLGIAYAGYGRIDEARKEFKIAFLSDSLVRLDTAYVSKTIESIFRTTIDDCKNEAVTKALRDSLDSQKKMTTQTASKTGKKATFSKRENAMLFVSGVCLAGFLATGGGAVYEYYSTSRAYDSFRLAASQGDIESYNHYRTIVKNGDAWTVADLSASVVFGICSGYFFSRYKKSLKNVHPVFSITYKGGMIGLAYEF